MIITETIAVDGSPVGRLIQDTNSQEIAFLPRITPSPAPDRDWESIDQLRSAIITAYKRGDGRQ